MNASVHRQLDRRKRSIARRIRNRPGVERAEPMIAASNIRYEIAEKGRAIAPGGIGAIHLLARKIGLVHDIDRGPPPPQAAPALSRERPRPVHRLQPPGRRQPPGTPGGPRNDEVYLDALGAERIPDPTTAGDFCRRFTRPMSTA